jgi:hypothetical protein
MKNNKVDDFPPNFSHYTWQEISTADEKAKVFNLIFESCQSNYSKISTWQAQYELDISVNLSLKNPSEQNISGIARVRRKD